MYIVISTESFGENTGHTDMNCSYLFHQSHSQRATHTVGFHSHAFWHMDWTLQGEARLLLESEAKEIADGNLIIIPPHAVHGFEYGRDGSQWISVKFEATGVNLRGAIVHRPDIVEKRLLDNMEHLLRKPTISDETSSIVEHHLLALLTCVQAGLASRKEGPHTLSDRVCEYLSASSSKDMKVSEIAAHFGYSTNHLSACFRKETGVSLKQHLDSLRCQEAKNLLCYSDMTINEIARELQFPDVFSFSRFFKRLEGDAPGRFRDASIHGLR